MDIFVTGIGVVSALGLDVPAHVEALQHEKSGIGRESFDLNPDIPVGNVKAKTSVLANQLALENADQWPRTALLGLLAAQQLEMNSGVKGEIRSGFINGSTTGGMDRTEQFYGRPISQRKADGWSAISTHDLGTVTSMIASQLGSFEYVNTISTACSSAANSIMLGARLIRSGMLDRVVVGGSDALTSFTINGFKSLMIYDLELCKPFDEQRNGLNLGEGAGYIMLENDRSLSQSNRQILARLCGWANANDAHHQTATSPDGVGAKKAMLQALASAGLQANDIQYLNAHGTATKNNDQSELAAIERTFDSIAFSSTKGFTGHTLGAAGGIEAVFSILSLMNQQQWPNIHLNSVMNEARLQPLTGVINTNIQHVMSNSFGFGGNSTSLIFSRQ